LKDSHQTTTKPVKWDVARGQEKKKKKKKKVKKGKRTAQRKGKKNDRRLPHKNKEWTPRRFFLKKGTTAIRHQEGRNGLAWLRKKKSEESVSPGKEGEEPPRGKGKGHTPRFVGEKGPPNLPKGEGDHNYSAENRQKSERKKQNPGIQTKGGEGRNTQKTPARNNSKKK